MAFLVGPMQHYIKGNKELTEHNEILKAKNDIKKAIKNNFIIIILN